MAEQMENLDDFVNSLSDNNSNDTKAANNDSVVEKKDDSKVEATDTKNKVETPKEVKAESGRTYTEDQVNDIVARRLARFKHDAIEIGVKEQTKDLEARLTSLETERNNALREAEVLRISSETGVKAELLKKTGLSGEELESFAGELKTQFSNNSNNNAALTLDNLVIKGTPEKNDRDEFYNQLLGGK